MKRLGLELSKKMSEFFIEYFIYNFVIKVAYIYFFSQIMTTNSNIFALETHTKIYILCSKHYFGEMVMPIFMGGGGFNVIFVRVRTHESR